MSYINDNLILIIFIPMLIFYEKYSLFVVIIYKNYEVEKNKFLFLPIYILFYSQTVQKYFYLYLNVSNYLHSS